MIITIFSNKTAFRNKTVNHVEISPFPPQNVETSPVPPQKASNKVFSTFQHDINYLNISIQITYGKVLGYFTKKVPKDKRKQIKSIEKLKNKPGQLEEYFHSR